MSASYPSCAHYSQYWTSRAELHAFSTAHCYTKRMLSIRRASTGSGFQIFAILRAPSKSALQKAANHPHKREPYPAFCAFYEFGTRLPPGLFRLTFAAMEPENLDGKPGSGSSNF